MKNNNINKNNTVEQNNDTISGIVERVVFHNQENGFYILRLSVENIKDLVTVVCESASIKEGEKIECIGNWFNDKRYGVQFKASVIKQIYPSTIAGIEKYLASGMIKGIGKHFAKRLIEKFGVKVFEVIEYNPESLYQVGGIGKSRYENIIKSFAEQKVIREIMVFLQSHGVSGSRAVKIYKTYGEESIEIISNNPYRLASDIHGIGFISADKMALSLGIPKDSMMRARASISYVLFEASSGGNCGLPIGDVISSANKLLEVEENIIQKAIAEEEFCGNVTIDSGIIYLTAYYNIEKSIAKMLLHIKNTSSSLKITNSDGVNTDYLSQEQKDALALALKTKILVLTGGPGTGKTTLINCIIRSIGFGEAKIKLLAPTGRAAKRLTESTGLHASTIHRILGVEGTGHKHNELNKINCNYVVVDEMSMVDIKIFYALLKALPHNCGVLLVGDIDQLPSVGPGNVLRDIIDSSKIETIKLNKIFRQSEKSKITTNAYMINNGMFPSLNNETGSDFYFLEFLEGINEKIVSLIKEEIPKKFEINSSDIQVLCPSIKGSCGVRSLNEILQKELNPNYEKGIAKFGLLFAVNDKVLQTENNYDLDVYNGDIGIIKSIDEEMQEVIVSFDEKEVVYDFSDLDQLTLAYATTIHKSQGSEYKAVVIPITMQSYIMLKRNLIYTAVTRGKKLVIVIGEKKALYMGIKNISTSKRYSTLKDWLIYGNERKGWEMN